MDYEKEWVNISLYNYYDNNYDNKALIRCDLSSSTDKFGSLEPPSLKIELISLHDNLREFYFISPSNCLDLKKSIDNAKEYIFASEYTQPIVIKKRYLKNKDLIINFIKNNNNESVCRFEIKTNENKYLYVNLPLFPEFHNFYNILKKMALDYIDIAFKVNNYYSTKKSESYLAEISSSLNQQKIILNNLSVSSPKNELPVLDETEIDDNISSLENKVILVPNDDEKVEETELNKEFRDFLGQEMSNIKIPNIEEIDKPRTNVQTTGLTDHKSLFFDKLIKWNIEDFEKMFETVLDKEDPLEYIINLFKYINKDYEPFLGMNETDKKSVYHLTHLFIKRVKSSYNYINEENFENINFFRNYYISPEVTVFNNFDVELAYDLLSVFVYVSQFRTLMNLKTNSFITSKAKILLGIGSVIFPFVFPVLFKKTKIEILRNIESRFNTISSKLFNNYNEAIHNVGLKPINKVDIKKRCEDIYETYISSFDTTEQIHDNDYLNIFYILPYKNDFNLEQIIKYIVPIEAKYHPEDWGEVDDELLNVYNCEDESVRKFLLSKKSLTNKIKRTETNLERYIKSNINDVSTELKNILKKLVEDLVKRNEDFDINDFDFPYEELPDNIIKGLYCWKPSINEKIKTNYKYFLDEIEDCIMDKQSIIDLSKNDNNEEGGDDWDFEF